MSSTSPESSETTRIKIVPFEELQGVSRAAISLYWSNEIAKQIDRGRQECGLPRQSVSLEASHACFESQHHLIAVKGNKNEIDTTSDGIHSAVGGVIGWRLIPDLYNESLTTALVSEIMVNFDTLYVDKKERHEANIDKMLIGQMACGLGSRVPSLTFQTSKQGEERMLRAYREMIGRQSWPTTGLGVRQMRTYEPVPSGFERGDKEFMWMRGFFRAQTLDLIAAAGKMPNMDELFKKYTLVYKVPAALSIASK